jgi:homopolymeric O-antigen transport system permease protein
MWRGDYLYLVENLVVKDFKIRYRNMSLGVLWSLLNPLVMMGVYYFVFTQIFTDNPPNYPLFLLCGMVPFSFFTVAWSTGTTSIVDNAGLIKRVPVPREVVPITTVLSCCIHLMVQVALLLTIGAFTKGFNRYWFWLPLVWALEIVFVCGLALLTTAVNVFVRDTRYVVESATWVLLFMVPVFYDSNRIPLKYRPFYEINPIAATVISLRKIVYEASPPVGQTLWNLAGVSLAVFLIGLAVFHRLKPKFYEHI